MKVRLQRCQGGYPFEARWFSTPIRHGQPVPHESWLAVLKLGAWSLVLIEPLEQSGSNHYTGVGKWAW